MRAEKDPKTGKWLIQYRYTDWQGKRRKSMKRGFETKRDAEEWLRKFLEKEASELDMTFSSFIEAYFEDMSKRLRKSTIRNKKYVVQLKILPYFGAKPVNTIKASDIRKWQNKLLEQGYSATYLRTINNQLAAIFNYAVKYYDLRSNLCHKAGKIGKDKADEMKYWTKEEFLQFIDGMMDKRLSYMAFMILYWTGMRLGELLALTVGDIDLKKKSISITKSLQRIDGEDVITDPKTPKSKREIWIPEFLAVEIEDYIKSMYGIGENDRLIPVTKSFLEHEIKRGIKKTGVKEIHIHCLRHSCCALMAELGFSPVEIAERLGHERVETTLNIYSHVYPEKREKIAEKMDQAYKESLE